MLMERSIGSIILAWFIYNFLPIFCNFFVTYKANFPHIQICVEYKGSIMWIAYVQFISRHQLSLTYSYWLMTYDLWLIDPTFSISYIWLKTKRKNNSKGTECDTWGAYTTENSTAHSDAIIWSIVVSKVAFKNIWNVSSWAIGTSIILTRTGEPWVIFWDVNLPTGPNVTQETT